MFDSWDRTTGNIASADSEKGGELELEIPVQPSVSVAKKSEKKSKAVEKEKLREVSFSFLFNPLSALCRAYST